VHLLWKLPYFDYSDASTELQLPGTSEIVRPYQIVFWVSVSKPGRIDSTKLSRPFPVVFDTGFTQELLIDESDLQMFTGLRKQSFLQTGKTRVAGRDVPIFDADLWVYRNRPGERDHYDRTSPFRIELDFGIGICDPGHPRAPRLPLLGLAAFTGLRIAIDGTRNSLSIRTPNFFERLIT
jgi:hypothetical protein